MLLVGAGSAVGVAVQLVGAYGEVRQMEALLASLAAASIATPREAAARATAVLCSRQFSSALQQVRTPGTFMSRKLNIQEFLTQSLLCKACSMWHMRWHVHFQLKHVHWPQAISTVPTGQAAAIVSFMGGHLAGLVEAAPHTLAPLSQVLLVRF